MCSSNSRAAHDMESRGCKSSNMQLPKTCVLVLECPCAAFMEHYPLAQRTPAGSSSERSVNAVTCTLVDCASGPHTAHLLR
jgi:hypothetical protein